MREGRARKVVMCTLNIFWVTVIFSKEQKNIAESAYFLMYHQMHIFETFLSRMAIVLLWLTSHICWVNKDISQILDSGDTAEIVIKGRQKRIFLHHKMIWRWQEFFTRLEEGFSKQKEENRKGGVFYVLTLKYVLVLWLLITINTELNIKQIRNKGLDSHDS